ncbi:MAG TPA: nitroreductase/quinone reductase family protein [Blastocatellia bacterium]|nr:nitroreductase/quinone reductase family protein [Blastocatellia bacterium]
MNGTHEKNAAELSFSSVPFFPFDASSLFQSLNQFAEPLIRLGFGNPILWPTGTMVIETIGRKTHRTIRVPLLATRIGDLIVVGTVRRRSQWVKNLAAHPEVRYWLGGKAGEATAFVFTPEQSPASDQLPARAICLAGLLRQQSRWLGVSFAVLAPRS